MLGWVDSASLRNIAFGLHNGLSVWQEGQLADITPEEGFTPGQVDGTGGAGYGTGGYGVGGYGEPSSDAYFPLTWSFGAIGGDLYASPRMQGVFRWTGEASEPAVALAGAPERVAYLLSAWTGQLAAFGCTDVGGDYNQACIRFSQIADGVSGSLENWSPGGGSTAQQIYLEGNGRIVAAAQVSSLIYVWTTSELHVGSFTGSWAFERVAAGCGLAGPGAFAVLGQRLVWLSSDLQFWSLGIGEAPQIVVSPVRSDFIEYAAPGQNDKIVGGSYSERGEVLFHYADRRDGAGYEVSRTLRLSVLDGAWTPDVMARTAYIDSSPLPFPVGVSRAGAIYWQERGESADGGQLEAYLETGGQYLDPAEKVIMCRGVWPDFRNQQGAITLTVWAKFYPQDEWREVGAFAMAKGQSKVDFLATGRLFKFRFASKSAPMSWRLGKVEFDVVTVGDR